MPENVGIREKIDEARAVFHAYKERLAGLKRGTLRDYKDFVLLFFDDVEVKKKVLDMIDYLELAKIDINSDDEIARVFRLYFEYHADREYARKTDANKKGGIFKSEEFYIGQMTA